MGLTQPSLRDSCCFLCKPGVETQGYFRLSLRDEAAGFDLQAIRAAGMEAVDVRRLVKG